nr:LETM1-like protein [Tanacetum cinerariifolium]
MDTSAIVMGFQYDHYSTSEAQNTLVHLLGMMRIEEFKNFTELGVIKALKYHTIAGHTSPMRFHSVLQSARQDWAKKLVHQKTEFVDTLKIFGVDVKIGSKQAKDGRKRHSRSRGMLGIALSPHVVINLKPIGDRWRNPSSLYAGVEDLRELLHKVKHRKLDGNIVQKHGGSKQVGFKQLGPGVETGVHEVSNNDTAVAQRRLEDQQPEEKTNTDCLVKEQEKEYQTGWKIKTGNVLDFFNQRSTQQCTGSMQVLYGFEFEVEPLGDHTFEVEP